MEATDGPTNQSGDGGTAERLAAEYQVDTRTVERAGEFVQGLDALAMIREDLPEMILTQQSRREATFSRNGPSRASTASTARPSSG